MTSKRISVGGGVTPDGSAGNGKMLIRPALRVILLELRG
jgi:hypothetical protein